MEPFRTIEHLTRHPGLSRKELEQALGWTEPDWRIRRTLLSWERQGLIRGEGKTSARRYFAVSQSASTAPLIAAQPEDLTGILSDAGAELIARVRRPLHERTPCSYERSFLEHYVPNSTAYLRPTDLEWLRQLGATPDERQPAGTYARNILERLLIDLSWNSSRLEGNTYSLLDTERLFRERVVPVDQPSRETQMLLNHKQAIEYLVEGAGELELTTRTVRTIHGLLAENLLFDPSDEGTLRRSEVRISESVFIPLGVPQLVEELFLRLLSLAAAIRDPFEQSFFLLVHLPYLQPFIDVNKRTARLAANLPLMRRNLQPLSFIDLPREAYTLATLAVYEERRIEALRDVYLWSYERSALRYRAIRASLGEPDPFRLRHRDDLRKAVRTIVQEDTANEAIDERLEALASELVGPDDRDTFARTARREIDALNEGTFARYRLRPSEFERWMSRRRP